MSFLLNSTFGLFASGSGGGGGGVSGANNGVSLNGANVVLGNNVSGTPGGAATLLSDREIDTKGFNLKMFNSDSLPEDEHSIFNASGIFNVSTATTTESDFSSRFIVFRFTGDGSQSQLSRSSLNIIDNTSNLSADLNVQRLRLDSAGVRSEFLLSTIRMYDPAGGVIMMQDGSQMFFEDTNQVAAMIVTVDPLDRSLYMIDGEIGFYQQAYLTSPANAVLTLNGTGADFSRLNFGGVSNLYPSLHRSGVSLFAELADGSDFSPFKSGSLIAKNLIGTGNRIVVADANGTLSIGNGTGGAGNGLSVDVTNGVVVLGNDVGAGVGASAELTSDREISTEGFNIQLHNYTNQQLLQISAFAVNIEDQSGSGRSSALNFGTLLFTSATDGETLEVSPFQIIAQAPATGFSGFFSATQVALIDTATGDSFSMEVSHFNLSQSTSGKNIDATFQILAFDDNGKTMGFENDSNAFRLFGITGVPIGTYIKWDLTSGNTIIGAGSDNGAKLQVAGNQSLGVVTNGSGTLSLDATGSHYIFTGTTATWSLPAIAGKTGWLYYIKNRGSGTLTINVTGGTSTIYTTVAVSSISVNAGEAIMLLNDGTFWNVE